MPSESKTEQLQVRVSPSEKLAIKKQAELAGMSMSEWVLAKVLPSAQVRFEALVAELGRAEKPGYAFAELLEFLGALDAAEFERAVAEPPEAPLDLYWQNYLAATVEHAASLKQAKPPAWTEHVPRLDRPVFASELESLRLHLLVNSPPAFLKRDIFIDASVGERV